MNPWQQLLAVQALDTSLRQLDHRDQQLPERTQLAETEAALADVRAATQAAETEKHGHEREQKRLEDEIATLEAKIEHTESQLYSGGSSDAGMLQDLQDEIASLKRRIGALEDEELEVMERIEPIDARIAELADEQARLDTRAVEITKALAEREAEIEGERSVLREQRTAALDGVPDEAVTRYEQVRDRLGGTAVAALEGGVCQACHLKLSAVERDRIQHLPPDEEVTCEECGRFLVRT